MDTIDSSIAYEALLWRYFAGEASSNEIELLSSWIKSNESHKADFHRIKELYYHTKYASQRSQFDSTEAYAHFSKSTKHIARQRSLRPWFTIAACVTLLAGLAVLYWKTSAPKQAAAVEYSFTAQKSNFILPDSSSVQLNRRASLRYLSNDDNKRIAELSGEAFFDIKHNAEKPFEVLAAGLRVRVLGTSFNVDARNPDSVIVSVATGRVVLISLSDSSKSSILGAGQSACFVKKQITPITASSHNALAWKQKVLRFDATPLSDVVSTLNSYFDTSIVLSPNEGQQQLTVQLTDPKLESVLQLLEVMYHLKTTKKDKQLVLETNNDQ